MSNSVNSTSALSFKNPMIPRILPFALFMGFIGLEELARFSINKGLIATSLQSVYFLYPVKALATGLVLILFWKQYQEIRLSELRNFRDTLTSVVVGLIVFILWINMDWAFGTQGTPAGFNPNLLSGNLTQSTMTAFRIFGAALVVPIMEELFWRSFLIRYIIDQDFSKIPIGRFTWPSFIISTALFGLEHNLFLAGMMAGIIYNLLLYRTKSLVQCILSHAITNLVLGLYVLYSGKWYFW